MTDCLTRLRLSFLMAVLASALVFAAVAGTTGMPLDGDLMRAVAAHVQAKVDHPVRVRVAPLGAGTALEVNYIPGAERFRPEAVDALHALIMEQALIRYPGSADAVAVHPLRPEDFLGERQESAPASAARASDLRRRLGAAGILAYGDFHWPVEVPMRPWRYLLLHHSAADVGSVEIIDRGHRQRDWAGIGYDFVIGNGHGAADGEIRSTFRWTGQMDGAHAGVDSYNRESIGICLVGDFSNADELVAEYRRLHRQGVPPPPAHPSAEQMESLRFLALYLLLKLDLPAEAIIAHRDIRQKACPGENLPMPKFVEGIRADLKRLRTGT
ncbi:MAG TPA: peptidoglycan recognition family protein [Planctomycetota bacterium]|nr:peptidoglycan recognition family protein [Planctomycetota bacterium]